MADWSILLAATEGLSGHSVRGAAESARAVAEATRGDLESTVHHAAREIVNGLNLASSAISQAIDVASDKAFEGAAKVATVAPPSAHLADSSTFSWGGYIQALGILGVLLGGLWFGVWALRKYGKFNFIPRPGALPRGALVMEAQLPLGPRKGLMVVRFLNRRLLLGVTEQQISLLTEEEATDAPQKSNFGDIMRKAGGADIGDNDGDSAP